MLRFLCLIVVLIGLLASAGYAARSTQLIANWHPMFVEPALGYFGLSFFGHEHTRHEYSVADGALVDAPITRCWDYDFLERDCDGPDHYKAFLDGSRAEAYKGDPSPISPPRAKACGVTTDHRRYCVSDWRDDGKTVWLNTGRDLERHTLAIGCSYHHFEYPCTSREA